MRARTKTIDPETLEVLRHVEIDGNLVRITQQLDRKLYVKTNDALVALGGKWNKKAKAHVFDGNPAEAIQAAVGGGTYESVLAAEKEFGFFPTPAKLANDIVKMAQIKPGDRVLEPSAGRGAIADIIRTRYPSADLYLCELLEGNQEELVRKGYPKGRICPDFRLFQPVKKFDRIVMNPPFAKQEDIEHVVRAYSMLAPEGKLVAIMSGGTEFRDDKKSKAFRRLVKEAGGRIQKNPDGAFKESGTDVRTVTVTLPYAPRLTDETRKFIASLAPPTAASKPKARAAKPKATKPPPPNFKQGDLLVLESEAEPRTVWQVWSPGKWDEFVGTYRYLVMDTETRQKLHYNEPGLILAQAAPPAVPAPEHPALVATKLSPHWLNLPAQSRRNLIAMITADPRVAAFFADADNAEAQKTIKKLARAGIAIDGVMRQVWEGTDPWAWAKHTHRLNILDADAFDKMTALEGKAWASDERKHASEPNRFFDAQEAYRILVADGLTDKYVLADVADSAGFVGSDGEIYLVLRDGEIVLLEDTAAPDKVVKAENTVRVIIAEDPDPFSQPSGQTQAKASTRKASTRKSLPEYSKGPAGITSEQALTKRWTVAELEAMPDRATGHFDTLKIKTDDVRVWISRDDGDQENMVYVEQLVDHKFEEVKSYRAAQGRVSPRKSSKKASKAKPMAKGFPVGAHVLVDGRDQAIVRGFWPEGTAHHQWPHYSVDFVDGDRNVNVGLASVGVETKKKGKQIDPKFQAALERYLEVLRDVTDEEWKRLGYKHGKPTYDYEVLRKYVRVFKTSGPGRSVQSFVDPATGDIFKSDGWKKPAKHARGNVYKDAGKGALGLGTSIAYLR